MDKQTARQRIDSALTRIERKHSHKFDTSHQAGGYRLTNPEGSREYSPRLPGGQFALWLEAFEEGLDFGTRG
jgi:hypothetical protein